MKLLVALLAAILTVAACKSILRSKHSDASVDGAAYMLPGSLFGTDSGKILAIGSGMVNGPLVDEHVGRSMDARDYAELRKASAYAFESSPSGSSVGWKNPLSGNSGSVTPTSTYTAHDGRACRSYHQSVIVDGHSEAAEGEVCRRPDGVWEVIG